MIADDPNWASSNWNVTNSNIDSQTSYSTSCEDIPTPELTYIPDNNFEQALINLGFDDILDNNVLTKSIDTITNLNISYKNII